MRADPVSFQARADAALADPTLKLAIDRTTGTAERKRAAALADFPQFAAARERGKRIKDHVVAHLDHYLAEFERHAVASGAQVHWAATADEASRIVVELCRQAGARRVTRVKSMLGEEIGLPHALDEAGFERVETDLAEHIVQLGGDRPSHIVWPSMHRTREQVSAMFKRAHRVPHRDETIEAMVDSARRELRDKFLSADVAISGANFLVADTGATCTVTNEGNAELTTSPPRVHIVTAGIEKLVPSTAHAFALLRLLVRSATGAELTQYTTFHCGPRQPGDRDGPQAFHIVLVDNGRTRMLAQPDMREMLRCIRCGACMNHCVVFRQLGGHAYGGTYPGPMGAVLTPVFDGLDKSRDLPHACTLNGKCREVCPVDIPLPTLLRGWRDRSWREGLEPATMRFGLGVFAFVASRPALYRLGMSAAVRAMRLFGRGGWVRGMPGLGAWTRHRDFPAPARKTFMAMLDAGDDGRAGGGGERAGPLPGVRRAAPCAGGRPVSTRDEILAAVRAALGPRPADVDRIRREAAALLDDPASIRPALLADSRVDAFVARATAPKVAATVDRIGDAGAFPSAVGRYLAARGIAPTVALQPAQLLKAMDWSGFELHDGPAADEVAAVGVARWGVAETGSLVFHSDAETPVLTHFLPLHHIVLLHAGRILAYLEDYAQAVQGTRPPRNVNLVTGASGTTDIEGSLVLGAHGPRHLHIVIAGA